MSTQTMNEGSVAQALTEALAFFEENSEHHTYGYGRPDDPRDFFPDAESCTAEELANHKRAVELWEASGGEPDGWVPPGGSGWVDLPDGGAMHILRAPWGIGTYVYRDEQLTDLREKARIALGVVDPSVTFYGPLPCEECGALIVKEAREKGGREYDAPEGPVYPNTVWQHHVHAPSYPETGL